MPFIVHETPNEAGADFSLRNHGSICILQALTREAADWVNEHIDPDAQRWGINGVVIEPRYVEDIVTGFTADGLRLSGVKRTDTIN